MSGIKIDPREKMLTLNQLRQTVKIIEAMPVITSCATCSFCQPENVDRATGEVKPPYCLKAKAQIPAHVFPNGCEMWDFDEIPF